MIEDENLFSFGSSKELDFLKLLTFAVLLIAGQYLRKPLKLYTS